jgi:predicted dehydrogenase
MTGAEPLGAVVVGTGFGVLTHLRALRAAGFEVRSLVGRDATKAKDRADRFGVPHATADLGEALRLDGVDAVSVATPPHSHAQIALAAIDAGKHVLCEKPFARDAREAESMLRAAQHANVVHLLGTEWRFGTGQASLTRTIRSGAIGEPRFALFQLQLPSLVDPGAGLPAWWEKHAEGGGWLGAYGSHVVDQVRTTLGEFVQLSASLQRLAPRPEMTADDTFTVHFELDNGCEGILHSSCAAGGQFVATTKITGTKGSAWLQGEEVFVDTGSGPEPVPPPDDLPLVTPDPPPGELLHTTYDMWHSMGIDLAPYARLYGVMRDRILGRPVAADPAAATFADGVACQAVLDAIHRSSDIRQWVAVISD